MHQYKPSHHTQSIADFILMCTTITFAVILVIHHSLSLIISQSMSRMWTSYMRVSVSSWTVFIGSLSTIFLPAGSLYLRVNYECPAHTAFLFMKA